MRGSARSCIQKEQAQVPAHAGGWLARKHIGRKRPGRLQAEDEPAKADGILGCTRRSADSRLHSAPVGPFLECCDKFWTAQYKRHGYMKSHENDDSTGASLLWEKAERDGTVQPGEGSERIPWLCINPGGEGAKRELGSLQWCPVEGQEALAQLKQEILPEHQEIHSDRESDWAPEHISLTGCRAFHLEDIQKPSRHGPRQPPLGPEQGLRSE